MFSKSGWTRGGGVTDGGQIAREGDNRVGWTYRRETEKREVKRSVSSERKSPEWDL